MEYLIEKFKGRRLGILFILKMVPQRLWGWRPQPTSRSTGELANHLAASPTILCDAFHGKVPDAKTYEKLEKEYSATSAKGLIKLYEEGSAKLIAYLKKHFSDAHEKKIQFFYHEHKTSIYDEVFDEMGHQWFHLGQLFVYLRQNKVEIDMGAYYGYKDPDPSIPPNE